MALQLCGYCPYYNQNEIDVKIKVVERWYVWRIQFWKFPNVILMFFGIVYKTLITLIFLELTWNFLNWYNFRGRNELLKIKFRKGFKEHYLFEYDIPYINKPETLGTILSMELFRMKQFHYKTIEYLII